MHFSTTIIVLLFSISAAQKCGTTVSTYCGEMVSKKISKKTEDCTSMINASCSTIPNFTKIWLTMIIEHFNMINDACVGCCGGNEESCTMLDNHDDVPKDCRL